MPPLQLCVHQERSVRDTGHAGHPRLLSGLRRHSLEPKCCYLITPVSAPHEDPYDMALQAAEAALPRIPAGYRQHPSFYDAFIQIEFQQVRGCLSFRRQGFDHGATDGEMLVPVITPRVEETNQLTGASFQGTDIAPLPHVATQASIGQIVGD